jgi:hypothetical protein
MGDLAPCSYPLREYSNLVLVVGMFLAMFKVYARRLLHNLPKAMHTASVRRTHMSVNEDMIESKRRRTWRMARSLVSENCAKVALYLYSSTTVIGAFLRRPATLT